VVRTGFVQIIIIVLDGVQCPCVPNQPFEVIEVFKIIIIYIFFINNKKIEEDDR
jgi:hypothetical protein